MTLLCPHLPRSNLLVTNPLPPVSFSDTEPTLPQAIPRKSVTDYENLIPMCPKKTKMLLSPNINFTQVSNGQPCIIYQSGFRDSPCSSGSNKIICQFSTFLSSTGTNSIIFRTGSIQNEVLHNNEMHNPKFHV